MPGKEIGIFRAVDSNEGWFELDVSSVLQRVIDGAAGVLGDAPGNRVYLVDNPQPGTKSNRVGIVSIQPVQDEHEYLVHAPDALVDAMGEPSEDHAGDMIGKPEINRRPTAEPGNWSIQSLIFDKEKFSLDQAREWIANHDQYGDYGVDETTGSFRFRQYDTKWFDLFRIITITEGVSAVYAQVAETELEAEKAEALFKAAYRRHLAIKSMNRAIIEGSLSLVPQSCQVVSKAEQEDAEGAQEEERFILGLVLEPTVGDGLPTKPDTQDDVYTAETIRMAAHGWMAEHGLVDLMHNWEALGKKDIQVLESYIAPVDFTVGEGADTYKVLKGTWLLALRVLNDALWTAIKDGNIGAFSIGGMANRQPLEEESTEG